MTTPPAASPSPKATDAAAPARAASPAPGASTAGDLTGYECLLCVCGGIAAYKTAALASTLVQAGCGVTAAMTQAARRFVGVATFQGLTGRPVYSSLWRGGPDDSISHLRLSESADLIVVAPATANIIGKLAGGLADDLVSSLLLGADCPVLMAPAMNARMWAHGAVQRNVRALAELGVTLVGPSSGWQACRAVGPGRMSEPDEIMAAARGLLLRHAPRRAASP